LEQIDPICWDAPDPGACQDESEQTAAEEYAKWEYEQAHRFDGIEYGDLFTDHGVVIKPIYMDWYIEDYMAERGLGEPWRSDWGGFITDNEYYEAIVELGPAAIPELQYVWLNSPGRGFSGMLFPLMMLEITQADVCGVWDESSIAIPWAGLWQLRHP
jgi:hypothetical protein